MRGKEKGGEVWGGSGKNGEPFLTLYLPDLIPLPGHSYIYLVMASPSGVVTCSEGRSNRPPNLVSDTIKMND